MSFACDLSKFIGSRQLKSEEQKLNERINRLAHAEKLSRKSDGRSNGQYRRPFWMPAIIYYSLTVAAALGFFLFIWAVLAEGNEESPTIIAFSGAILLIIGAVVVREFYLREAQKRFVSAERKLEYSLSRIPVQTKERTTGSKLSVERNAEIIKEIKKKSEVARTLGNVSNGHWNVIEICSEYLSVVEKQMETVGTGSPRLAGLRRGREIVRDLHHFHTLAWAEIESRSWSQKAQSCVTISDKLSAAQEALSILDSALRHYPNDSHLTESELAIKNFIASIKVSHWVEQAERAAFKGNNKRAVNLYRDALFFLAREDMNDIEQQTVAEKINSEIERLRNLSEKNKKSDKLKRGKNEKGNEYSEMSQM